MTRQDVAVWLQDTGLRVAGWGGRDEPASTPPVFLAGLRLRIGAVLCAAGIQMEDSP